jgi:hypothetical protein
MKASFLQGETSISEKGGLQALMSKTFCYLKMAMAADRKYKTLCINFFKHVSLLSPKNTDPLLLQAYWHCVKC